MTFQTSMLERILAYRNKYAYLASLNRRDGVKDSAIEHAASFWQHELDRNRGAIAGERMAQARDTANTGNVDEQGHILSETPTQHQTFNGVRFF